MFVISISICLCIYIYIYISYLYIYEADEDEEAVGHAGRAQEPGHRQGEPERPGVLERRGVEDVHRQRLLRGEPHGHHGGRPLKGFVVA